MKKIFPLLLVMGMVFQVLSGNIIAGYESGDIIKLLPEYGVAEIKVTMKKEQVVSWHWMVTEPTQPSIPEVRFEIRDEDRKMHHIGGDLYVYADEHSGSFTAPKDGVYHFQWINWNDFTVFVYLSEFDVENADGLDAPSTIPILVIICIAMIIGCYRKWR